MSRAAALRLQVMRWEDALKSGNSVAPVPPSPDGIFSIIYTSGTTGSPKGAILSHRNVAAVTEMGATFPSLPKGLTNEVHMSYLPLAHVFEREFCVSLIRCGASIGFFTGVIANLFNDISELRPTFLIGVPRVWKRLYDKVMGTIASSGLISRALFRYAYWVKTAVEEKQSWSLIPWDSIVFSKLRAKLGGRCAMIVSGGAALSAELSCWVSRCFLVDVYQGYGLTETMGGITTQLPGYDKIHFRASIGAPLLNAKLRLVDVPDMGYYAANNAGEIWMNSPCVFQGYYHDEEKTFEALAGTRWLRTGDIGRLNEDGSVSVVDRKKNMFKLSQGEYVCAEYLENLFGQSTLIAQIWIHGEPTDAFVVAVVVVNPEQLVKHVSAHISGLEALDAAALCKRADVTKLILDEITRISQEAHLPGFQVPRAIVLETQPFAVENDLLTPTFKLRRQQLRAKYAAQLHVISEPLRV
jgi:long-chain acyl-CoA synthetase